MASPEASFGGLILKAGVAQVLISTTQGG